eukprot:15465017-Alexandrium_andersonii.AAC.1
MGPRQAGRAQQTRKSRGMERNPYGKGKQNRKGRTCLRTASRPDPPGKNMRRREYDRGTSNQERR